MQNLILRTESDNAEAKMELSFVPTKTMKYMKDIFLIRTKENLPFFMVLSFIAPIFRLISLIVIEKESKVREGMKMMGLKDRAYWLSWFAYYIIICIAIVSVCPGVLYSNVYQYTSYFLWWLIYFLFGMAIFSFGLFLAALFNKARIASITGTMIYFATYLLIDVVAKRDISETNKNIASLFPTLAVSLGTMNFVTYEAAQTEITMNNIGDKIDNYRFSMCLVMLIIDFFFWGILAL